MSIHRCMSIHTCMMVRTEITIQPFPLSLLTTPSHLTAPPISLPNSPVPLPILTAPSHFLPNSQFPPISSLTTPSRCCPCVAVLKPNTTQVWEFAKPTETAVWTLLLDMTQLGRTKHQLSKVPLPLDGHSWSFNNYSKYLQPFIVL